MSLNARQSRFLAEYLQSGNATQAAITAVYSEKTADQIGSTLLKNVDIAAQVAKAARANEVTIEHWVKEVSRMAFDIKPVKEFTYDHKLKSSDLLGKHIGAFHDAPSSGVVFRIQINLGEKTEAPVPEMETTKALETRR